MVLLDEIEKAHPDVFNLLLQVLDDGQLTDSMRRKVNFKNTVLIMTSNLGTRMIKGRGSLGFQRQDEGATYDAMRNTVLDEVKRAFNPEFLNRIDDIIVFRPLGLSEMERITGILLDQLRLRLSQQKIELEVTPEATQILIQRGFDLLLGSERAFHVDGAVHRAHCALRRRFHAPADCSGRMFQ